MQHRKYLDAVAAFLIYLTLSLVFFGRSADWTGHYLGVSVDPVSFVWFLNWWPFALRHGLNPFISQFVWAPQGGNLTWSTSIPTLALAALPITLLGGPVVSYNLVAVAAPALSAGTAFLLARYLTRDWAAALVGGYIYGFSSYELGQMQGHPNLAFTCLLPLMLLLCARRARSDFGRRPFIVCMAALILAQLGVSTEILLTFLLFGAIFWAVFLILAPAAGRPVFYSLALEIITAGLIAIVAAAPFFVFIVIGLPAVPDVIYSTADYSSDLLNFVLPTTMTAIGWRLSAPIANAFTGNSTEQGAYLGLPLLGLLGFYFLQHRQQVFARALLIIFVILCVGSLGPLLHYAGHDRQIMLPWRAASSLPLLEDALPCRFSMYVSLVAAIAASCYLAGPGRRRTGRFVLAGIAVIALVPNLPVFLWSAWPAQAFFSPRNVARVIGPNHTAILLPFGINGPGMAWQLDAGMAFKQAGGYIGFVPEQEWAYPATMEFLLGEAWPNFGDDLTAYCATHHVDALLIGPGTPPAISAGIQAMGWQQQTDHGMLVVKPPAASGLAYYYAEGDYWASIAPENWMGRQVTVSTHDMPVEVTLTGSGYIPGQLLVTQTGPGGSRNFYVGNGQTRSVEVPANTAVTLTAAKTFVPARVIHNGDTRHLSILISFEKKH